MVVVMSASTLKVPTTVSAHRATIWNKMDEHVKMRMSVSMEKHNCLEEMREVCKNTLGSFECVCTEGYELSTDSLRCERICASASDTTDITMIAGSDNVDTAVIAGIAVPVVALVGLSCFLLGFFLR